MTTTDALEACIVLARVEEDYVWDGKPYPADLGLPAGLKPVKRAITLVWCLRGTDADLESARKFARREGYSVLTYSIAEGDPLARAKRDVLRAA